MHRRINDMIGGFVSYHEEPGLIAGENKSKEGGARQSSAQQCHSSSKSQRDVGGCWTFGFVEDNFSGCNGRSHRPAESVGANPCQSKPDGCDIQTCVWLCYAGARLVTNSCLKC